MSRFLSDKYKNIDPYVPGEQPKGQKILLKLNTNENPFPPSPAVKAAAAEAAGRVNFYNDPQCRDLKAAASEYFGVPGENILFGNGSDENLDIAVRTFAGDAFPLIFPDLTYSFYDTLAGLHSLPVIKVPLAEDFTLDLADYRGLKGMVIIANPNAPTGLVHSREELEAFIAEDPERLVLVDEAYVDFGNESCVPLISKYDNLIVTMTFSKSRSMAGARLGMSFACKELMDDMEAVRNSCNPYNINSMTSAMGVAALKDAEYTKANCEEICRVRDLFTEELRGLGFDVIQSHTNFVLAKTERMGGKELYLALKDRGILIRHFDAERIKDYNRITIGTEAQMILLLKVIREVLR